MSKWNLPTTLPGGSMLPHMSARMRTETIDALFEASGGFERAQAWIEKNDDNYSEFFKIWAKGAVRSSNVEVGVSEGVEALLDKLDKQERSAGAIDVTPIRGDVTDVEPV
jgi:hypothetical protein